MIQINDKGILEIGGVEATELARKYKTPLYVMDKEQIEENIDLFKNSLEENYAGHGMVMYASKAFCCKEMYRILKKKKIGADIVSLGEMYTALSVSFPAEKLMFHGNNKSFTDIVEAINHGVGRIVIDSLSEAMRVIDAADKLKKDVNVLVRVNPGIEVHTHEYIQTGQVDSKFGIGIGTKMLEDVIVRLSMSKHVKLKGFHAHIGSQIFEIKPFEDECKILLEYVKEVKERFGVTLTELDLGGGFGIRYTKEDDKIPFEKYLVRISAKIEKECARLGLEKPYIYIEPGRSIVGEAGVTLYTVGTIKEIENVRKYVSIDGGMTDNIRYALYQAKYDIAVATRMHDPKKDVITLAGKCCESGDLIGEHLKVQKVQEGDLLAVFSTGAYNYSMASNYNRIPRPAVVMCKKKKDKVVIKGETLLDMHKYDV